MVCTRPLPVGTTLDFRCELYPDKFLDCKVEVMHVESEGMGTMITEIDDKTSSLYQTYLEEIYVERMSKNRKPHPKEE
jgi:hypothetical protein